MLSTMKQATVHNSGIMFDSSMSALWKAQYTITPLTAMVPQSIRKMLQYGSEFLVKYQFNILSNGFFIHLPL
jgi:hypothetical protein